MVQMGHRLVAGSYFDATNTTDGAVQNANDTNLNDIIEAGDFIAAVAVVDMTFCSLASTNLSFTPFA